MTNGQQGYSGSTDAGAGYASSKDTGAGYAGSLETSAGYVASGGGGAGTSGTDGGGSATSPVGGVGAQSQRAPAKAILAFGNGVNLQPSYGAKRVDLGWPLLRQALPAIKTVRILIEPDKYDEAVTWISEAQDQGYQVIAAFNDSANLGKDSRQLLLDAANWWQAHYAALSAKAEITVNLRNEWGSNKISAANYAKYCDEALKIVRTVYAGTVVLDAPGYGQAIKILLAAAGQFVDRAIAFSIHVYPNADNAGGPITNKDLEALDHLDISCLIGEFGSGYDPAYPPGKTPTIWADVVKYAKGELNWPVLGWCWAADNTGKDKNGNNIDVKQNMNMITSQNMSKQESSVDWITFDPWTKNKPVRYTPTDYFGIVQKLLQ